MKGSIALRVLNWPWKVFRAFLIVGISYIILFPVLTKISGSLMSRQDIISRTVVWIPRSPNIVNYEIAWSNMHYPVAFFNTVVMTLLISLLQLGACTLVGYGLARYQFRGQGVLFGLVIFSLIIPPDMILIPLYLNFRFFDLYGLLPGDGLNLINTYWPFVLPAMTATGLRNGLFIYIMRQFFKGMPKDLEEAALVDGAGALKTFYRVMLPGATPALVIVFLFSFVWTWNDYTMIHTFGGDINVLSIALDRLPSRTLGTDYWTLPRETSMLNNAGSLLVIAPLLLLYTFLQRYFVESVERTGLGG